LSARASNGSTLARSNDDQGVADTNLSVSRRDENKKLSHDSKLESDFCKYSDTSNPLNDQKSIWDTSTTRRCEDSTLWRVLNQLSSFVVAEGFTTPCSSDFNRRGWRLKNWALPLDSYGYEYKCTESLDEATTNSSINAEESVSYIPERLNGTCTSLYEDVDDLDDAISRDPVLSSIRTPYGDDDEMNQVESIKPCIEWSLWLLHSVLENCPHVATSNMIVEKKVLTVSEDAKQPSFDDQNSEINILSKSTFQSLLWCILAGECTADIRTKASSLLSRLLKSMHKRQLLKFKFYNEQWESFGRNVLQKS